MKNQNIPLRRYVVAAAVACLSAGASAVEIDIGNSDWSLRHDNTVRASTKFRTESADPALKDAFRPVPTGAPPPAPATFAVPEALNLNAGAQNWRASIVPCCYSASWHAVASAGRGLAR